MRYFASPLLLVGIFQSSRSGGEDSVSKNVTIEFGVVAVNGVVAMQGVAELQSRLKPRTKFDLGDVISFFLLQLSILRVTSIRELDRATV